VIALGVSTVMASTIIFYSLLVVAGFIAGVTIVSLTELAKAYSLSVYALKLDSIEYRGLNYTYLLTYSEIRINLTNTGPNTIYDYNHIDVIVRYTDSTEASRVYVAEFKGGYTDALAAGIMPGWYIYAFYDVTGQSTLYTNSNPSLWKPNLTIEIVIVLPSQVQAGTKVSVTIATPRGGTEYVEFTWITG
jgi:archaellum component FlaF (FlaF/FlaG flagellin family)